MSGKSAGVAQLLFATAAWGSAFSVTKVALVEVDPFHMTSIRYGFAALVFLLMLLRLEGPGALRPQGRGGQILVLGAVGIVGGVLLMVVGLARTRAEHAAVIVASQPLMAAVMAWLLHGQRPARHTLIATLLAFSGVVLVATRGDPRALLADASALGDLLVLGAALCWVTYTLGARAFANWSPLRYTALTAGAGALSVLALNALALAAGIAQLPAAAGLATVGWELFYITVVSAMLATLSWNSGIRRIGPEGVLFINFVPVTAFAIGIIQGYRFNWAEVLGAALVVGALLGNHFLSHRAPQAGAARAADETNEREGRT